MEEEALTFGDLRKIEKTERRQDNLSELDENFLIRASQYLDRKKDVDNREFKNAKRVLDKIVGLRQDKIVKNAKISVKSDVESSSLNLLPREKQFFRDIKERFNEYSEEVNNILENKGSNANYSKLDSETDEEIKEEELEEDSEEESYEKIQIISKVPEFMGTDLESYGPFSEGEEVKIPEENADILINRGSAERVDS